MNKLTTIYNVMKNMKDYEKIAGDMEVKIKKDDETVVELNRNFDRNKSTKTTKVNSSVKILKGDENFEHQSSTTINGDEWHDCRKGFRHHGMMRKMMMEQGRGISHFSRKKPWERFMLMIDLLNRAEIEKLDEGNKKLRFNIDSMDLPDELKETIMNKLIYKHHMAHYHGMANCSGMKYGKMSTDENLDTNEKFGPLGILEKDMALKNLKAEILINDKDYIENVEINLELSNNEEKEIKFSLNGKVNEIS